MGDQTTPQIRTPAGYSRQLYLQAKQCQEDLLAQGYELEAVYLAMVRAVARVAYAEGGQDRLNEVGSLMAASLDKSWMNELE